MPTVNTNINDTLKSLEKNLYRLESKMENGFTELNNRMNRLDNRLWFLVFWITAGFAGVLGLIANCHHLY